MWKFSMINCPIWFLFDQTSNIVNRQNRVFLVVIKQHTIFSIAKKNKTIDNNFGSDFTRIARNMRTLNCHLAVNNIISLSFHPSILIIFTYHSSMGYYHWIRDSSRKWNQGLSLKYEIIPEQKGMTHSQITNICEQPSLHRQCMLVILGILQAY